MIPGSANSLLLASAAATGYQIQRSARFNAPDSAHLSRTPGSAGNRKTWTWAGWVKRSVISLSGANNSMFSAASASSGSSDYCDLRFEGDSIQFDLDTSSTVRRQLTTVAVFRDPAAWYHVVCAMDSDNATAASRLRIWVNNQEQTLSTTLDSGVQGPINNTVAHRIGGRVDGSDIYFSGYLADIHFIDGQALTPSSFAETNAITGQWVPKAFNGGSYGTNGFRLAFSDNSTAAALGTDSSGNGNTLTVNNLSVTAGAGNDSLVDSPTSYGTDTGAGEEVRGSYATLNPLFSSTTLTNGNLDAEGPSNAWHIGRGTIAFPASDKWYWEATVTGTATASYAISVATASAANQTADFTTGTNYYGIVNNTGSTINKVNNGTATIISTAAAWAQNDILMCAYDGATGKVWFGRNGTWYPQTSGGSAGNPGAGTNETMTASGTVFPAVHCYGTSADMAVNFGQRPFAYTAPSGFKALVDTNLTAPVIAKPSTVFDTKLYTGNGSTQNISGLEFSPDLVWVKMRSGAAAHSLYDIVRGTGKTLSSSATNAEAAESSTYSLTAFNSDGFALGTDNAGIGSVNLNGYTYAAWCWDAGSTTVTNTAGSISSQVRANPSAGFSVVTYTGSGSAATVGHGLGVAPSMSIVKVRNRSGDNWLVYHKSLTTPATDYLLLNSTAAAGTLSGYWNGGPTSSVIGLGNYSAINNNSDTYVAYCFAPVAGYSAMGSYVGNGSSTDNTFVYTGMRPRFVMLKRSDSTGNWVIWDAVRNSYNVANSILLPNSSAAEFSPDAKIDILSNGFKVRDNSSDSGSNGATYIYAAFAESPFAYSRAR